MKKYLVFALVFLLSTSLYGCVSDNKTDQGSTQNVAQDTKSQDTLPTQTEETNSNLTPEQEKLLGYAFHTFILWVPGVSYTVDDYNANTRTLYTSAGTVPESTITAKKDGTYIWNSHWDGKVITGNWTSNSDGTINILKGQEGKDWLLQKKDDSRIYLGDGSIYYEGESVTVENK